MAVGKTDFVTNLLMNNSDFIRKIKEAKDETEAFKVVGNKVKGSISSVVSTLGSVAGAAGIAVGGLELFFTAINSNMESSRDWNIAVDAMKSTVNEFFTALKTGNWKVFEDGIDNAIKKAKEYGNIMYLLRQHLNLGLEKADRYQIEKEAFEDEIESPFTTKDEKTTAWENYKEKWEKEKAERLQSRKFIEESLLKSAKSIGFDDIINTPEDFRDYFDDLLDPKTFMYKQVDEYIKKRNDAKARYESSKRVEKEVSATENGTASREDYNKTKEYKQAYDDLYDPYLEKLRRFRDKYTPVEGAENKDYETVNQSLQDYKDHLDRINTGEKAYFGAKEAYLKALKEGKKTNTPNPSPTPKPTTSTAIDYTRLDSMVEGFKLSLPVEYNLMWSKQNLGELKKEESELIQRLNNASSHKEYIELQAKLKFNRKKQEEITEGISLGIGDLKQLDIDLNPDMGDQRSKGQKLAEEFAEGYATTIGNADFSTQEGREAVARETIESIKALIVAKAIESAMMLPFPANIIAAPTAAAAVAGLFSLIPAFSTGGIFEGRSNFGDMNLARVNAGEMILNNRQQRNLFNLLNGNGASSSMNGGNVTFHIEGKQLVGVLNNYNSKMSKVR